MRIKNKHKHGMTLIEIMLVLVLVGFLISIFARDLFGVGESGKVKATRLAIGTIEQALGLYRMDCNTFPTTDQGLKALETAPAGGRPCPDYNPRGYMGGKKTPKDPWGNDFLYESNGSEYEVKSLGADGAEGGEGFDKDLSSKEE